MPVSHVILHKVKRSLGEKEALLPTNVIFVFVAAKWGVFFVE